MSTFYAEYPTTGGGVTSLNGLTGALTLVGAGGITITPSGTTITITGTGGTVTSVGLADDSTTPIYGISGSPVTTSGTLAFTLLSQTANTVLAGPVSGGSAQPTFRGLVSADIPNNAANTTGTASNVTGVVAILNGGTGQTTKTAAFNALSPLTTTGDLLYYDGGDNSSERFPIGATGNVLTVVAGYPSWQPPATSGTVTSVSVASAHGFAGTVANPTTTPALTLSTTVTGILQGNGTSISAASTTGSGNIVLATSPTIATPTIGTIIDVSNVLNIEDSTDNTKALAFNASGNTTGITLTLASSSSTSQTLTLPNITAADTIATLGLAQTFAAVQTFTSAPIFSSVTSGQVLAVDGSKNLISVPYSTTNAASTLAEWDTHSNLQVNTLLPGYNSVAMAGGTTTLTISSAQITAFTGSGATSQTVKLPSGNEPTGATYTILNLSTGTGVVTVNASGGGLIQAMAPGTILTATVISGTPTTAANWKWVYENLDGSLPMINPMSTGGDTIYGGASGVPTRLANGTSGQVLQSAGSTSAPTWSTLPGNTTALKAPTVQKFTSGTGTYTLPSGPAPLYIKVIMVGAGGGGAGGGTGAGTGGTGGNTTFGTSLLVANGGVGGVPNAGGGAGGTASLGSGPIGTAATGGIGQGSAGSSSATNAAGGGGGVSPFGGAGAGVPNNNAGTAAATNSGSGGGGGSATIANASPGGGAGGYIDAIINSPSASYSYAVGAAGTAGTVGTSGSVGGAGGSGYIIVFEYYQ